MLGKNTHTHTHTQESGLPLSPAGSVCLSASVSDFHGELVMVFLCSHVMFGRK